MFKLNQLGYMDNFLKYQINIIRKTKNELIKKLELVKNYDLYKPSIIDADSDVNNSIMNIKLKSKLSKHDLTVLFWWLAEAGLLEFEESNSTFVKSLENNLIYFDKKQKVFSEMKGIAILMSRFTNKSSGESPETAREELLKILQDTLLPPTNSVLQKNKWSKT